MGRHRPTRTARDPYQAGRLTARPLHPTATGPTGLHALGLDGGRDGFLYVPAGYQPSRPLPLVLMLHGAGGGGQGNLWPLLDLADAAGLMLLGPDARRETWDVIRGGYGPDVAFIDRALAQTFSRYAVDPTRLAIEGFSDGASYALSLGLSNGDLFTHGLAFSPGFLAPAELVGQPRLFIAHGVHDDVLPIDHCSRRLVPGLQQAGYSVRYEEFDGPHTVPPTISRAAVDWFTRGEGA